MDISNARPSPELASLTAAALQNSRFKERKLREAQSDVRHDAVYFSPVIKIDADSQRAVMQYRDAHTGEIQNQYPSPQRSDSYAQVQARSEAAIEAVERDMPEPPKTDEEA
jgi:hypothetical protein